MTAQVIPMARRGGRSRRRSLARADRWYEAERRSTGLLRLAHVTEMPARQTLIDRAHIEGAKADVLRALADGHRGEARKALACWRRLRRGCAA